MPPVMETSISRMPILSYRRLTRSTKASGGKPPVAFPDAHRAARWLKAASPHVLLQQMDLSQRGCHWDNL